MAHFMKIKPHQSSMKMRIIAMTLAIKSTFFNIKNSLQNQHINIHSNNTQK